MPGRGPGRSTHSSVAAQARPQYRARPSRRGSGAFACWAGTLAADRLVVPHQRGDEVAAILRPRAEAGPGDPQHRPPLAREPAPRMRPAARAGRTRRFLLLSEMAAGRAKIVDG